VRDIDLKTLRLFVAVSDCRSMARAAEQEHIEPSAISKRIAQLEDDLGVELLVRGRRGVQTTPAGLALLERARSVLFTMDRIVADAASFAGGVQGHVRLIATASAIAEALLDDIASFMREPDNEHIKVDIEERVSRDLVREVRDGNASLGVCWDHVDFEGLAHRPYRRDRLALAVYAGHALAGPRLDRLRGDARPSTTSACRRPRRCTRCCSVPPPAPAGPSPTASSSPASTRRCASSPPTSASASCR
jgi:DNA-binding transcriptional LysR family regulator